ncbi:MAG: lysoplasmalogenase [Rhodoferax sp.]
MTQSADAPGCAPATQHLHPLQWLALVCAVLATLSALGWQAGHWVLKPSVMLWAIAFVALQARRPGASRRWHALLIGALLASLAGDVFLMLPGDAFIAGLASFLLAHLCYIALFRQGQRWFPSRTALGVVLALGAGMYALIWPGLHAPVLQLAVAAYVCVIALMVAQALGRAQTQGTALARGVALGAGLFMLSDSLIAINRFVSPLPLAPLWILGTYYAAQLLMLHHLMAAPQACPR